MFFVYLFRDVIQTKRVPQLEVGEPINRGKFEKVTVTVKSFEKFVPFEKVLDVSNLPKDSDTYYLFLSKYKFHFESLKLINKLISFTT
jgi:hypothetical protein